MSWGHLITQKIRFLNRPFAFERVTFHAIFIQFVNILSTAMICFFYLLIQLFTMHLNVTILLECVRENLNVHVHSKRAVIDEDGIDRVLLFVCVEKTHSANFLRDWKDHNRVTNCSEVVFMRWMSVGERDVEVGIRLSDRSCRGRCRHRPPTGSVCS